MRIVRKVPLGIQTWKVGDAAGVAAADLSRSFATPHVVNPGEFCHIILRQPVGTNTGSQIIRGTVTINGYFE